MNNVVLIGRLTKNPELRYTQGGTGVARFTLAVDKQLSKDKKQEFEAKGQPTADFINITVWGKMGENAAKYLAKGRLVAINGRMQSSNYTDDEGIKRFFTDVVAREVEFLEWGDKKDSKNNPSSDDFSGIDGFDSVDDDNIPF